jgi:hypothetical protein
MRYQRGWKAFETHACTVLGLQPTIASGSQWHDPGDGVDRRHHSETDFALLIDAKYTESNSFSVNAAKLFEWVQRAQEMGRRFAMPIRLLPKWADFPEDYVVLRLDDLGELLDKLREAELREIENA